MKRREFITLLSSTAIAWASTALVAVFWLIAIVVFVRGFKRWVHGDQIEEEEDRLLDDVMPSQRRFPPPWSVHSKRGTPRPAKD